MFGKWKENLDKGGECVALFVDLSKAFDCLQHNLLLAKLNAYWVRLQISYQTHLEFSKQQEIQNQN